MPNFEGINRNNKGENDDNIFKKIRENKGLKILAVGSVGIGLGEGAVKIADSIKENKIELSREQRRTKRYDTTEKISLTTDTVRYLSDSFISKIAIEKVNEAREFRLLEKTEILKSLNSEKNNLNNNDYINQLIKWNHDDGIEIENVDSFKEEVNKKTQKNIKGLEQVLNEIEQELQRDQMSSIIVEKKEIKDKITEIMVLIEQAKLEVIKHIESKEYLEKLSKEMNISQKLAKLHQNTRINNVKNISYELKNGEQISKDTEGRGYAYYSQGTNKITLPYDISEGEKRYFYETIIHEILHESTMFENGLSGNAEEVLIDSFKNFKDDDGKDSLYFSNPGELIVRKQILDLNMEKNGIKKYGEKFNEEHYQKLLKLKNDGKLMQNERELIDHIKPEDFVNIMNGLASSENKDKNYYNPNWNYGENQG